MAEDDVFFTNQCLVIIAFYEYDIRLSQSSFPFDFSAV